MAEETEDLPKIHARIYPGGNTTPQRSGMQLILGRYNNIAASADGVLVTGDYNVVGEMAQNVSLLNSSGCIVAGGLRNVTIINSSGITVLEENTVVQRNVITQSPSSGVITNTPYKKYVALLVQSGTNAPVATVLGENTIGNIVWTRSGAGTYLGTLTAAFPDSKTYAVCQLDNGGVWSATIGYLDTGRLQIVTGDYNGILNDGTLRSIEIRVYN